MNSTASGITDGVIEQELADSAPSVVRRRPHALYLFVLGAEATQADRPDEFAVDTRYPEPEVSRRLHGLVVQRVLAFTAGGRGDVCKMLPEEEFESRIA